MITERDALFVSDFINFPLSKENKWINRYFKTRTRRLFVKYFLKFNSTIRFCQHSGELCTKRYLKKMKMQYLLITEMHSKAKREMNFEALVDIEKGRYALCTASRKKSGKPTKNL